MSATIFSDLRVKPGGFNTLFENYRHPVVDLLYQLVVVNASTTSETDIGRIRVLLSITDTLSVLKDIQLHLYNTETNALLKQQLMYWSEAMSTAGHPVTPYFIEVDVAEIGDPEEMVYFNKIPTSFSLEQEQADMMINTARRLLRKNPEYQKLLHELGADTSAI